MLRGVLDATHDSLGSFWFKGGDRTNADAYLESQAKHLADFVGTKTFAVGDNLTYIDFTLFEVLDFMNHMSEGKTLKEHANLATYIKRME